jgi:alanine racemase
MFQNTWVETDLGIIRENYRICTSLLPPGVEAMAGVKANAYGHGDAEVARALEEAGCRLFAVANVTEAVRLRDAGIRGGILILGFTPPEAVPLILAHDLSAAVISEEHAASLAGSGIRAQFAIDTGMNRIGLDGDDPDACERVIRGYSQGMRVEGLFTHLCVADTPSEDPFTERQKKLFYDVADRVKDLGLRYIHCLNSAGALRSGGADRGNVARLGIVLYGIAPDRAVPLPAGIRPALEWKTFVSMVKTVKRGETVGYGRNWRAGEDRTIATFPVGYADGYSRLLSNRGFVTVNGMRAPVVGNVCMDQTMIDVTGIPGVHPMTEVTLIGGLTGAEEAADLTGTIPYEILCGIGIRVTRKFRK